MRLRPLLACALCFAIRGAAQADTYTGATWSVRFNLPDQTTTTGSVGPDEYLLREAFLSRINALASNDWACLATYTFSGNTATAGAAGPILAAVSNALARGVKMGFVVDNGVDITSNYWPGVSLSSLAARPVNPLQLSRGPDDFGIMHHKVGVFWHRAAAKGWVLTGSWNFTGGASSQQWNILTEIQNNPLVSAYSNEMHELLSGRFHANPAKSHAHDATPFRLPDMDRDGWVRFAPYPDGTYGGTNALTDIVAAIDAAQDEIFFALNKLTRQNVADALVRACNRGVIVHGVIPRSDRDDPGDDSYAMYQALLAPTNYVTRNRVRMYEAYYKATRTSLDPDSRDLVHTKFMVIDPRGVQPMVIHGSANWTASALVLASSNDENVLFLPHRGMAMAFLAQFAAMTDGMKPWCELRRSGASLWLDYWLPESQPHSVVAANELLGLNPWTSFVQSLPAVRGVGSVALPWTGTLRFFRIQPTP